MSTPRIVSPCSSLKHYRPIAPLLSYRYIFGPINQEKYVAGPIFFYCTFHETNGHLGDDFLTSKNTLHAFFRRTFKAIQAVLTAFFHLHRYAQVTTYRYN